MPRRKRNDRPGAIHHVMNRGLSQRTIFLDHSDRRYFLSLLAREVRRGLILLHAFTLMDTHFHLLVVSLEGRLSDAMWRIQLRHVSRFNRKTGRDGPLFRNRFKSILVEDTRYWLILRNYIDDNPVQAGLATNAREYPYGSAFFLAQDRVPRWLVDPDRSTQEVTHHRASTGDQGWIVNRSLAGKSEVGPVWPSTIKGQKFLEWIDERSLLADGLNSHGPCASPRAVLEVMQGMEQTHPDWLVRPSKKWMSGWMVLRVALLRSLCRLSRREISAMLGMAESTVAFRQRVHASLLSQDQEYSLKCEAAAGRIVALVLSPS